MRVSAVLAPTLLFASVHALPRQESWLVYDARPHDSPSSWKSGTWNKLKDYAIGWFGMDLYDTLQDMVDMRAPDKTVMEWLESEPNFSNITKLIKYDSEIAELLSEASHGLTFLAPNNKALTPPRKHKDSSEFDNYHHDALGEILEHGESLFSATKDDDKDKERKKKMLKALLNAVLRYHILPYDVSSTSLGYNSSVQTNLIPKDGSYAGQNRRLKVEKQLVPPTIKFNKYSTIVKGDNKATNGYVHEIDHLLLPPPSALVLAHLFPQYLSTSTSAIQKVGLEDALDWRYVHGKDHKKGSFEGTPVVSVFIPDNDAWKKLPERLILYLFSPVGAKTLSKLLQFHTVPRYIIHSEWIYNGDEKKKDDLLGAQGVEMDFKYSFPTALKNHYLPVHIIKSTPTIPIPGVAYFDFEVLGQKIDGTNLDLPTRNGVVHITSSVFNPRKTKKDHYDDDVDDWEDWEDWLPAWGDDKE